jgi:predicted nucleotidyltransferase
VADEERAERLRNELDRLVHVVSTELKPEQILVFGSMAHGNVGTWSDLDVVVIMETKLPFLERLSDVLERVRPQVTLDLFVYTPDEWALLRHTRPFIRDEIAAKGAVVYERLGSAVG